MSKAFNTSSWFGKEESKKAKLKLVIPYFSDVLTRKGEKIRSKIISVGRSKFSLEVYPSGVKSAERGMISVFLQNESNHDVEVDYTITAGEAVSEYHKNTKIEKGGGVGRRNFMKAKEVEAELIITVGVDLKWEDISGGMVEENSSEERVMKEIKNLKEEMKNVRAEIAKVKTSSIPECPVCFQNLGPPKKIVQCLKVGQQLVMKHIFLF